MTSRVKLITRKIPRGEYGVRLILTARSEDRRQLVFNAGGEVDDRELPVLSGVLNGGGVVWELARTPRRWKAYAAVCDGRVAIEEVVV